MQRDSRSSAPNTPRVSVLVAAAGNSQRMGSAESKIFMQVLGRSVIERCLSRLCASKYIERIVVLARAQDLQALTQIKVSQAEGKVLEYIVGGATRQESVFRGLEYLNALQEQVDFVLVHDAARCFISKDLIDRCIESAFQNGAVTAAQPQFDTLKLINDNFCIVDSVSRENLWCIQTPQVFAFETIFRAHLSARERSISSYTDDSGLLQGIVPVKVVRGENTNIKITTKEDLPFAEALAGYLERVP